MSERVSARKPGRVALGWLGLLLLLGYTAVIHHGMGPAPGGIATRWWQPTGFLLNSEPVGSWIDAPVFGIGMLTLPAALLAGLVFAGTRSAVARMLAISCVATVMIFSFYGLVAIFAWKFFHWRGSLTMVLIGLATGAAAAAPLLGASWRRRGWLLRVLLYLPVFFASVALIRNATGTDDSLAFNFSPWPAIPIFGLEIAGYVLAGLWFGVALAVAALALGRAHPFLAATGALAGLALPTVWFWARFSGSSDLILFAVFAASTLALTLGLISPREGRRAQLLRRAGHIALGATLVCLPVLSGRALAQGDYTVNRFVRAERLNVALGKHYEEYEAYPDSLLELVERNYIAEVPQPRVGFAFLYRLGWLEPIDFTYQSLGSSYQLEFVSTKWIQCTYTPPWYDEEEEEEGESEESWNCPDSQPELW